MTDIVLIVDDDPIQRRLLDAHVARMGLRPLHCDGGRAALDALGGRQGGQIAAVVLDLMMPDKSGMEVMAEMRRSRYDVPIVVQTAKGSIDTVVEAMRAGAFDFVVKPVAPERLRDTLANAVRMHAAARPKRGNSRISVEGASPVMRPVLQIAAKSALSNIPILVEGETGAGKEWLARAIRSAGERASKPFVAVNCGAIPADLLESELFGHEKGAFTGAITTRRGRFEMADGGTLFLDEIGDMSLPMQVKILRALQERTYERVGSNRSQRCDVRIIAATHRNLEQNIIKGTFREDLFYRLNVFPIEMPPLRERLDDLPLLIEDLIHSLERNGHGNVSLAPDAVQVLRSYHWPGNVRELANLIERLAVLHPHASVQAADLPARYRSGQPAAAMTPSSAIPELSVPATDAAAAASATVASAKLPTADVDVAGQRPGADSSMPLRGPEPGSESVLPPDGVNLKDHIENIELNLIRQALAQSNGVVAHAAKLLNTRRTTLVEKLRKYGLTRELGADAESGTPETQA